MPAIPVGPDITEITLITHQRVVPPDVQVSYFRDVIYLSPQSLVQSYVDTPYSQVLIAYGGNAPYTYAVGSGSLPAGLTLNSTTGVISGTPTTVGVSGFTILVTDVGAKSNTLSYAIRVISSPVESGVSGVSPSVFPNGGVGAAYSQVIVPYGGTAPYTYAVISGTLPDGLALDTDTGIISGTPTTTGTSNFVIEVTDDAAVSTSRAYNITIDGTPPGGSGSGGANASDFNFTS